MRLRVMIAVLLLAAASLPAERYGRLYVADPSRADADGRAAAVAPAHFFAAEMAKGNLVLVRVQRDTLSPVVHTRYRQYHRGLPVWGGEVVSHQAPGRPAEWNGQYHAVPELDLTPAISAGEALAAAQRHLGDSGLRLKAGSAARVIFPRGEKDFRLAWRLEVEKEHDFTAAALALVDAADGAVLLCYPRVMTEDLPIGSGTGQRGDTLKFPVTLSDGLYYMRDEARVRPVRQLTYDFKHSLKGFLSSSQSRFWQMDNVVNIHAYVGYCYDFYYVRYGLRSYDNQNKSLIAYAHVYDFPLGIYDNALYGGGIMYFYDPGNLGWDFGAALDVVAHEFSHGVTDYHSELIYSNESGALNEAFSDIIGAAVEFHFQEPGSGYSLADWTGGEDALSPFSTAGCRNLADPNANSQMGNAAYPDPCHLSQKIITSSDRGGVHLNSTIFSHAFYLLAAGGTNRVSGLAVGAIGIQKATDIFYNAFVNHMINTDDFLAAANKIVQSAAELYGGSSNEFNQTRQAMRAIGYTAL